MEQRIPALGAVRAIAASARVRHSRAMTDRQLVEAQRRSSARFAFDTAYAVDVQIKRLRTIDMHDAFVSAQREADAQFLVVALWRLRMAAQMCATLSGGDERIIAALATYDEALPRLKNLRDVLMHYDNYALANEFRRNTHPTTGKLINRKDVESLFTSPDGVAWLGTSYSLDDLEQHSRALYASVTEVLVHSGLG